MFCLLLLLPHSLPFPLPPSHSGGTVSRSGFHMLTGNVPLSKMVARCNDPLKKLGLLLFGPYLVPVVPFREMFFRSNGKRIVEAAERVNQGRQPGDKRAAVCMVGGVNSFDAMATAMEDGFELVQMGRALLSDPAFVKRMERELRGRVERRQLKEERERAGGDRIGERKGWDGSTLESHCTHCNECVITVLNAGTHNMPIPSHPPSYVCVHVSHLSLYRSVSLYTDTTPLCLSVSLKRICLNHLNSSLSLCAQRIPSSVSPSFIDEGDAACATHLSLSLISPFPVLYPSPCLRNPFPVSYIPLPVSYIHPFFLQ